MKIALVSLDQLWEDKTANQQLCLEYIKKASYHDADLIVFPEMTLTGFSMNTKLIGEYSEDSETVTFFTKQAKEYNIYIAFGVVYLKNSKATNNLIVTGPKGKEHSAYAKIHPFSYSGENNVYLGGNELVMCNVNEAVLGLTICYDLRFPEIYRYLSEKSNLILVIANWPEKRIDHWFTLLKARAIENQVYIAGVNRTGSDGNGLKYIESSFVFDPVGQKIEPLDSYHDMKMFDILLENVESVRISFPVRQDRKTDLYKLLL